MREYQVPIREALTRGLRPEPESLGYLTLCKFGRPTPNGLVAPTTLIDPFDGNETAGQLFRGNTTTLLAKSTTLFEVDESADPWTTSALSVTGSIVSGGVWQFIDLYNAWILLNGSCVVYKDNSFGMFDETQPVMASSSVSVNTGCAFNGRVLLGGFDPSAYWSDDWRAALQAYAEAFPFAITQDFSGAGNNFVFWSTIGGGDVLKLFNFEQAVYGNIREDERSSVAAPMFMYHFQRNECGLAPMPWRGVVQAMIPFHGGIGVYGTDGIAILTPASAPYPTFGMRSVARFGIASRGAVAGSPDLHVFISGAGVLWTLDGSGVLTRLGYKEYLEQLLGYPIQMGYDATEQEYHITGIDQVGAVRSYVLGRNGLARTPYHIRNITHGDEGALGSFDTDDSTEVLVVTERVDFSYRDLKSITGLELGIVYDDGATADVAVDWRIAPNDPWTSTEWVPVNNEGFAYIRVTAQEFRFRVRCSTYVHFQLLYINVKWQPSGRRIVRGLGANEAER